MSRRSIFIFSPFNSIHTIQPTLPIYNKPHASFRTQSSRNSAMNPPPPGAPNQHFLLDLSDNLPTHTPALPPPSSTYRSPKHPLISNKLTREPLNTLPLFPPSPLPLRCNPFLLSKKSYLRSTYTTLCSQNRPTYLKLCIVHLNLFRTKGSCT